MWRAVTWPVRSRPVRRVLLLWLGMQFRRRLRAPGAAQWSGQEQRRSRWPWLLALAVAGFAAGLAHPWRRQPRSSSHGPQVPIAAQAVDPTPVASTPESGTADLSKAPERPDLAAGEAVIGRSLAVDDLKVVEGIGPKIEQLLNASGVHTWHDLSVADVDRLRDILREAGARYRMHDPSTWPQQATLLARGDWVAFTAMGNGDPDS